MQPLVSINGQIQSQETAAISPFDRGFLLGDGLFETIFADRDGPWYLVRHLTRLAHGAQVLGVSLPAELETWVNELVRVALESTSDNIALRITVSRGGTSPHPPAGPESISPLVTIAAFNAPITLPKQYELGISAQIAEGRRNERSPIANIKTTSFGESVIALRHAIAQGFDDVVFLNTMGFVAEAATSNLFMVMDGALITPPITHGILPGITRAVVLELATQHTISATEREVGFDEILSSAEVFLTNSIRGIVPLVKINEYPIGSGAPGEVTRRVMRLYAEAPHRV